MKDTALKALADYWKLTVRNCQLLDSTECRNCYKVETESGWVFCKVQRYDKDLDDLVFTGLKTQEFALQNGVPASRPLRPEAGVHYHIRNGHCVTAEEWLDHDELTLDHGTWRQLGVLCGQLHSIPIGAHGQLPISRMDPRRSLSEVQEQIGRFRSQAPVQFLVRLEEFIARAETLDEMPNLKRALIHSDITWKNVIRTGGRLAFVDFEGSGAGPPVMDLVEVTTKLCEGPSGSGPLMEDSARAFYEGYCGVRPLSQGEITEFLNAHFFHQFYHLADSMKRQDFDFISRMHARMRNWEEGVLQTLLGFATG